MERQHALELLHEYTESDSLRKHAYAVEAAMRHYAGLFEGQVEQWGLVGLLHDFDYERWPEAPDHTRKGAQILRERGVCEEVIDAILSHAEWNEIPRDTALKKAIFAVDELCGFIMAVAYVRPSKKLADVQVKSVKKKMKDKAFARAVKREDITQGAALLEMSVESHIEQTLTALKDVHERLGL